MGTLCVYSVYEKGDPQMGDISKGKKVRPLGFIRVSKATKAHIPEIIRNEVGTDKIPFVANANTILLYNSDLDNG